METKPAIAPALTPEEWQEVYTAVDELVRREQEYPHFVEETLLKIEERIATSLPPRELP